jgi:hypothetical protein
MIVSGVYRGRSVVRHGPAAAGPVDRAGSPGRGIPSARHATSGFNASRRGGPGVGCSGDAASKLWINRMPRPRQAQRAWLREWQASP